MIRSSEWRRTASRAVAAAAVFALPAYPAAAQTEITPPASACTASTVDGTNVAGNVADNNLGTRWSGGGDGAWLQLDLGSERSVGRVGVAVYQGNGRRNRFDIQVSTGDGTWTNALTGVQSSGTTTAEQFYDFPAPQNARLVRYLGHLATLSDGSQSPWNSVTEISVFESAVPTSTPTPGPGYVELTPAASAVTASTNDGNLPGNTVDGSLSTRWSANGDGAWIQYDLGAIQTVGYVKIAVYSGNSRRNRFDLQVSSDGAGWTNVITNKETSGTTTQLQDHEFDDVSARYVRYVGHMSNVGTFNSVSEVEVWGNPCTDCPPPPTATPTPTPTSTPITPTPTPTPRPTSGGPTDGWTQRSWTYTMHKPWNQPLENRFSYSNGVWTCWLFPNDPPFQPPPKEGGPRTELRWQNDYTSGQRMWDSDLWVLSPTRSTIMQLFGGSESQTGYQIRSFEDGTLKRYTSGLLASNAFGRWINAKVAHNVGTHTVRSYIDNVLVRTDPDRGPPSNVGAYYFKNGLYGCSTGRCESRFRNTKQWTR